MKKRLISLALSLVLLLGLVPASALGAEPQMDKKPHTVTNVETEMTFWGWTRYITYELDGYEVSSLYSGPEYNTWAFLCMEPQDQLKVARWYLPGEDRTEQFGYAGVELLCKTVNDAGGWTQAWKAMERRLERKYLPDLEPIYGEAHYGETVAALTGTEGEPALGTAISGDYSHAPETAAVRECRMTIYGLLSTGLHAYNCCLKALQTAQAAGTKGAATWTTQYICDNLIYPGVPKFVITAETAVAQAGEAAGDLVKQGYSAMLDSVSGLSDRGKKLLSLEGGLGLMLGERSAIQNLVLGQGADLKEARDAVVLYRKLADGSYQLAKTCYQEAQQLRKVCVEQAPEAVELYDARQQREKEEWIRWTDNREESLHTQLQQLEQRILSAAPDQAVVDQIEAVTQIEEQHELVRSLELQYLAELQQVLTGLSTAVDQALINNEILPRPPEGVSAESWAIEQKVNVRSGEDYYFYAERHPQQQLAAMEALSQAVPELMPGLDDVWPIVSKLRAVWNYSLLERDRAIDLILNAWKNIENLQLPWLDTCKGHHRDYFEKEIQLEAPRKHDEAARKKGEQEHYKVLAAHEADLQDQFRAAKALCESCTQDLLQEIAKLPESLKEQYIVRQDHLTGIPFEEAYERGMRRAEAMGLKGRAAAEMGYLEQRKVLRQAGEALGTHYEKIMDLGKRLKMAYNAAHSLYHMHHNLDLQMMEAFDVPLQGYDPDFWEKRENAAYAEDFSLKDLVLIPGWQQNEVRNFRRYLSQMLGCGRENLSVAEELSALKTAMPEIRRGIYNGTLTAEQVQRQYLQKLEEKINRQYQDGYDSFDPVGLNSGLGRDTSLQAEYDTLKAELQKLLDAGSGGYVPPTGLQFSDAALTADRTLTCGEQWQRSVSLLPADATIRELIWTTTDEQIARVSPEGVITGVSDGVAEIAVRAADSVLTMDPVTGEKTYDPAPLRFSVQVGGGARPRADSAVQLEPMGSRYLHWEQSGSLLTAEVTVAHCDPDQLLELQLLGPDGEALATAALDTGGPESAAADQELLTVTAELPEHLSGAVTVSLALSGAAPILTASVPVEAPPAPHGLTVVGGGLSPEAHAVDLQKVLPGTRVLLTAAPGKEGQEFAGWTCDGGSFEAPLLPTAVFVMPDHAVTVRAAWKDHVHSPGPAWFTGNNKDGESAALHWKLCTGCGQRLQVGLHAFGPWIQEPGKQTYRQCSICGVTERKSWGDEEKKPGLWGTPLEDSLRLQWEPYAMDDGTINCHSYELQLYAGDELLEQRTLPPETRSLTLEPLGRCTRVTLAQNIQYTSGEVRHGRQAQFCADGGGRKPVTAYADETTPGRLLVENTLQRFWYDQADLLVELAVAAYDEAGRLLQVQLQTRKLGTMEVLALDLPEAAEVQVLVLDPQTHVPIQKAQRISQNP